jgi:hypothetical protein
MGCIAERRIDERRLDGRSRVAASAGDGFH